MLISLQSQHITEQHPFKGLFSRTTWVSRQFK